jgi:hypothetical protein
MVSFKPSQMDLCFILTQINGHREGAIHQFVELRCTFTVTSCHIDVKETDILL